MPELVDRSDPAGRRGTAGAVPAVPPARTAGALLGVSSIQQLGDELRDEGLSDDDLEQVTARMDDPRLMIRHYPLVQTVGYRPTAG